MQDEMKWCAEEFGSAQLGNAARTRRLTKIAEGAFNRPAGKISEIFDCSADREGAYKFFENELISSDAIAKSAHLACAQRCSSEAIVFVPVDGSTLSFLDDNKIKGLGPVGIRSKNGRGLQVMSAIAVHMDGWNARRHMWPKILDAKRRAGQRNPESNQVEKTARGERDQILV